MAKGIYKRGNIYWIRYVGLDGRVIRESSKESKFKDAETLLIKRRQTIKEGKQPDVRKIANFSFKELSEEYIKWAERQRCFKSKSYLIDQLTVAFRYMPLRRFSSMLLEQYQTERINKGNKPATINRFLATIKHMFTKAVEWDMVEEETLRRIRKVKLLEENNRRLRYLSKEEIQDLLDHCDSHLKPIVTMALNTGCRKSEILNLRWDQVDLKHGFVLLDRTKNGERREIPINQTLKESLENLFKGTQKRPRRLDIPWVFYETKTGKNYQDVKRSFKTACQKAGIKDFTFHDLRHCFASHLVMSGVDLTTIKELLGHKTLTMTLRYAHLAPSHKVNAVKILDSAMNERSSAQKEHNPQKKGANQ